MQLKFLPLLILLAISALLSANIHYASAQHQTITFIIDPCTTCQIKISNGTKAGTITQTYFNGNSSIFWHGGYNITALLTPPLSSGYSFRNWNYTTGITAKSNVTNPTNITYTGTVPATLTLRLNAPSSTIQPFPILLLALLTSALPVLLRRAKRPIALT